MVILQSVGSELFRTLESHGRELLRVLERVLEQPFIGKIVQVIGSVSAIEWVYTHPVFSFGVFAAFGWLIFAAAQRKGAQEVRQSPPATDGDQHNLHVPISQTLDVSDIWYFDDGVGPPVGPLNLEDLKKTIGTFSSLDKVSVWNSRLQNWKQAKDIPELKL
ncbi:MAG: hypothetical protein WAL80_13140 [Xanthobacteraceae bacterium]|jgi:hypothetical protein